MGKLCPLRNQRVCNGLFPYAVLRSQVLCVQMVVPERSQSGVGRSGEMGCRNPAARQVGANHGSFA
jgi:hypothetical protein